MACKILVPWPGIEPVTPAVGACSFSHWPIREICDLSFLSTFLLIACFNIEALFLLIIGKYQCVSVCGGRIG